jgi:hypothetical protein
MTFFDILKIVVKLTMNLLLMNVRVCYTLAGWQLWLILNWQNGAALSCLEWFVIL